jgi:F-type H+-transporting ATPase subunit alpha
LSLAQYRELAAFAQFASDLDDATRKQLERGRRVTELMKQLQYAPLSVADMAITLYASNEGFMDDVDVPRILPFEAALHQFMHQQHAALVAKIAATNELDKDSEAELKAAVTTFKKSWA